MVTTNIITKYRPCLQCGGRLLKKSGDGTVCKKCLGERERQDVLFATAFRDRRLVVS